MQTIVMPNGINITFDDCWDNLLHTRDYALYLDTLSALSEKLLIIASVNDNFGRNIPDNIFNKMRGIGFKQLKKIGSQRYICVIERGKVWFEVSEEENSKNAFFEGEVRNVKLSVTSKCRTTDEDKKVKIFTTYHLLRNEAESEIKINGTDYSMDCSGLNIVVFDLDADKVVDSSNYDFALSKPTFFHKNPNFDEGFFNAHFFLQPQYNAIWKRIYEKSYYSNQKLGVKEVENGIFLPVKRLEKNKPSDNKYYGGVCDERFNFISGCEKFIHNNFYGFTKYICGSYYVPESDLDYIDEVVVYGGWFYDHPGHLIDECFSLTIWYLALQSIPNLKVALKIDPIDSLYPENKMGKHFFTLQFLAAMGIPKERIIVIDKPTKFKKIIVPEQSFCLYDGAFSLYSFTDKYMLPYKLMRENAKPTGFSKVYFTKSKSAYHNVLGEDYFIDFYRRKGFEIIDPEEYSVAEKAGILLDADEFVTLNGSSQHYAVFCKSSVKITILQRDNKSILPSQTLMTEAAGINDIYIVDISLDFIHQDLYGNVNLIGVTDEWKRYVKEVYDEDVEITKEDYIKSHMYEYLCFYPKYYLQRQDIFNGIKNLKALDMLKNMSEVLLGKELDTNGLNLTTNEDILREKCEQSNADLDFTEMLFHDVLFDNKLSKYLRVNDCKKASLLCSSERVTNVIKDILASLNIELICVCSIAECADISDSDWKLCKDSDLILGYDTHNAKFDERDGICVIDVRNILIA